MILIKEINETVNYLTEDSEGKKVMHIEGPMLVAEKTNKNGRSYPKHTMLKEVDRYTREYINNNRAFGELGHPETPSINPDRISHRIISLKEDGNQWIGKAKLMDTPMGNIAKNLIEGGGQLGVSSRGLGSLKNINGINVVQPDFHLATAADIVVDPSAPGAFVQGIMENVEWVLVEGIWTQRDIEESQILIRKASRKDIEKVSLHIFENFMKKL